MTELPAVPSLPLLLNRRPDLLDFPAVGTVLTQAALEEA